jgi:hypothetical protein
MTPATSFSACIATNDLAKSSAAVLFACSAWLGGGLAVMHSLSNFQIMSGGAWVVRARVVDDAILVTPHTHRASPDRERCGQSAVS